MKLVPPKRSRKHSSTWYYLLKILFLATLYTESTCIIHCGTIHWQACVWIEFLWLLYKHLRTHTNFLEMYGKWACIHEFSITQSKFQPSLILRFGKRVHVLGIGTTYTDWDDRCSLRQIDTWIEVKDFN